MKTSFRYIGLSAVLMAALGAWAQPDAGIPNPSSSASPMKWTFEGVDITPFVEHFRPQVKVLTRSFTVYNWSPNGSAPYWKTQTEPQNKMLMQRTKKLSQSFWRNFGTASSGSMYGYGLYTAVDPVVSYGFGSGPGQWLLLELEFPIGLRLLELEEYSPTTESTSSTQHETAGAVAARFGCPSPAAHLYFASGGASLSDPRCKRLIRHVFDSILRVDAFSYSYSGSRFDACPTDYVSDKAFVVTRPDWLRPELVKYYSGHSRFDLEGRRRIQTLFLEVNQDGQSLKAALADLATPLLLDYLTKNPDSWVEKSISKCAADVCVITVRFCNLKRECRDVELDPIPRQGGGLITREAAMKSTAGDLLWPDLENKPKAPTVSQWLKENRYKCTGEPPYDVNAETPIPVQ